MRRVAALARKVGEHVARRFGSSSASRGPLPGATGRVAPVERKAPAETRDWRRKASTTPASQEPLPYGVGKLKVPAGTRRGKVAPLPASLKPLRDAVGRKAPGELKKAADSTARTSTKVSGPSAASTPLPPPPRKAPEGQSKAKIKVNIRPAAPSTSTASHPPPPPPHADSDKFWYKLMMVGGASLAFLLDFLKGYVEKEVDLKMKHKEAEEKDKLIRELEAEKHQLQQAIAAKLPKSRWFQW